MIQLTDREQIIKFWSCFGVKAVKVKDCKLAKHELVKNNPNDLCHYEYGGVESPISPRLNRDNMIDMVIPNLQDKGFVIHLMALEHKGWSCQIENVISNTKTLTYCDSSNDIEDILYLAIKELIDKGVINEDR